MKSILTICLLTITCFIQGCKTAPPVNNIIPKRVADPVDFRWIKSSNEVNLATVDIYFHGTARGKYIENKKWSGRITGEIYFKPKYNKYLNRGLYISNCTIQVNKDSSIKIIAPAELFLNKAEKIMFTDKNIVVVYKNSTLKFKSAAIWL